MSDPLQPHGLYSPWNSPGQNTVWVAFPFSRGPSQPRNRTRVSYIAGRFFSNYYDSTPMLDKEDINSYFRPYKLSFLYNFWCLTAVISWMNFIPHLKIKQYITLSLWKKLKTKYIGYNHNLLTNYLTFVHCILKLCLHFINHYQLTSSVVARLSLGVSSELDAIQVPEFTDFIFSPSFSWFSEICLDTMS